MTRRPVSPVRMLLFLLPGACATTPEPEHAPVPAPAPREIMGRDHPVFSGLLTLGGGEYDHDTDHSPLEGDTAAYFYRFQVEGCGRREAVGGGIQLEGVTSDSDLFEDIGLEPNRARWWEVSPYVMFRAVHGRRFRMPSRLGFYYQELELEGSNTGARGTWDSFGMRFAVEPEWVLHSRRDLEVSLFGELVLGGGFTDIKFTGGGLPTQNFDTVEATFGAEFGPRIRLGVFTAGVSFVYRLLSFAESHPEGGFVANGVDSSFTGLAVTLGARF